MFDALGVTTTCFLVPFSTSEGDLFTCFVMIFQSEGKVIFRVRGKVIFR